MPSLSRLPCIGARGLLMACAKCAAPSAMSQCEYVSDGCCAVCAAANGETGQTALTCVWRQSLVGIVLLVCYSMSDCQRRFAMWTRTPFAKAGGPCMQRACKQISPSVAERVLPGEATLAANRVRCSCRTSPLQGSPHWCGP